MSAQFELHLTGANSPAGELDADHLLAIVKSLNDIARRIGRLETGAERLGRAPNHTQRVAKLVIGLQAGSTRVLARRAGAGEDALEFDLSEERAFDEHFAQLIDSIADDHRPEWVNDSLARAAGELTGALQQAATRVTFKVDQAARRSFVTAEVHRETWASANAIDESQVTFVGRLFMVNLETHRLEVIDDVGHKVALPEVEDDVSAARLINSHVVVTGQPEKDAAGRLVRIHEAGIQPAPVVYVRGGLGVVPLDDILASAPGPDPDGGLALTDEEFDEFMASIRG